MPQFLNEANVGMGNALSSIGSSLQNWGMHQMQIKQQREQQAQDLEREQKLWEKRANMNAQLGIPPERQQQVLDEQTGKAMQIHQQWKAGNIENGTVTPGSWQETSREPIAPKKTFEPSLGGYFDEQGGFTANKDAQDFLLKEKAAGASRTNVSLPGQGPQENEFQKQIGKASADAYLKSQDEAGSAGDALEKIGVIKQIMASQQTGKAQEALAQAGQYFGTEAGANYQAFQAATAPLVLQAGKDAKGAMSEKDRALFESAVPSFGKDPRANAVIIDIVERAQRKVLDNATAQQAWIDEKGSLRGFKPAFTPGKTEVNDLMKPASSAKPTQTAINPKTGQRVGLVNGQWVPL